MDAPTRLTKSGNAWRGVIQIIEKKLSIAILALPNITGHHPIMSKSGEQIGHAIPTERGFELHVNPSSDGGILLVIDAVKDNRNGDLVLNVR